MATSPPAPAEPVGRAWLMPMVGLVAAAVAAVELAYLRWPVPPGVDPADWIQRSYAWVGLPAVDADAVGSPYLYPPMIFPLLGITVRLTGSPLTTALVFGGAILVVYGLTTVHLARRFLNDGTAQLLVVGLAVLNGTTLQILFWGGYPNFLALALGNEVLVFLLAFVRSRSTRDGLLFYGGLALVYLTHDLTFLLLLATVLGALALWSLEDRRFPRILGTRGSLLGLALLGGTVAAYSAAIRFAHIQTPGYLGSNPAAYTLDNLGGYFRPLGTAPMFLPASTAVNLPPDAAVAILLASAGIALGIVLLLRVRYRLRDPRWTVTAAWIAAVLAVPAVGWLAHVDTDYTRFVYFLPLPLSLAGGLLVEPVLRSYVHPETPALPTGSDGSDAGATPTGLVRSSFARRFDVTLVVGVLLLLLFAGVSLPTINANEQSNAGPSHDAAFLASLEYLHATPVPGSVLTTQSAVRWVEAVASRGAFDIGPTWLLFEPWQIVDAEETYWAFNARYALTNNVDVLAFSGGYAGVDSSPVISAPLYAAYVQGVAVPLVDLQTAGVVVNVTSPSANGSYPVGSWHPPGFVLDPNGTASATLRFTGPLFSATEVSSVSPRGGAQLVVTVLPANGTVVHAVQIVLTAPSPQVVLLHAPTSAGVTVEGSRLLWNVSTVIGPNPSPTAISTAIDLVPAPASTSVSSSKAPNGATLSFPNPGGGAWSGSLTFTTGGTSNPAIVLPPVLDTAAFLAEHHVHFMLIPSKAPYTLTSALYQLLFGWKIVYTNPEWTVLKG